MTRNASFIRKVIYISLMALLLIPLSLLSQPSGSNVNEHPGGKLDQMRHKYDLSLSSLGDVDPTSETMKLATLGMRGVACAFLWQQREEHKMKQNWEAYAAVNNQIAKLQPHFIKVWTFTSWDESYNVSVEFDDYRMRYHWVKKGIDHVIEGTRYNRRSPKLMTDLAWVFGHKLGRSDERVQFRREFKRDTDFHEKLPIDYNDPNVRVRDPFPTDLGNGKEENLIDNWLVSREFYLRSIRIAESPGASKELGQSKLIFYSNPGMASMNYADNVEIDGYFGDQAGEAWRSAGKQWSGKPDETGKEVSFGERYIPTSFEGVNIRLNYLDEVRQRADQVRKQLDDLVEDQREAMRNERLAQMPADEKAAYDTPAADRTPEQHALAAAAEQELNISHVEVAEHAPPQVHDKALRLAMQLTDLEQQARFIDSYRNIVNFEYWKTRAQAEQSKTMVDAKRDVYQAQRLFDRAVLTTHKETVEDRVTGKREVKDFPGAKETYEAAFRNWAKIFRKYPIMIDNPETEDLLEDIQRYREVLGNLDQEFPPPEKFPLQVIVDMYDSLGQRRANSHQIADEWVARPEIEAALMKETPQDDPRTAAPKPPSPSTIDSNPRDATPSPPLAPAN